MDLQERINDIDRLSRDIEGKVTDLSARPSRANAARPASRAGEKRMNARLLGYWDRLRENADFASITTFDVEAIPEFGAHAFMLDLNNDTEDPLIRYVGRDLTTNCGVNVAGRRLSETPAISLLARVARHYRQVVATAQSAAFADEFVGEASKLTLYRGVMLPFTKDGRNIDYIVGAITSRTEGAAPAVVPGQQSAHALPGDNEARRLRSLIETEVGAALKPQEAASPLDQGLRHCRVLARRAAASHARSRQALYEALARTYEFHFQAEADPVAHDALLAEHGLTRQDRAPFTPIVKLVFGTDYDKTRLSEYAAALGYAKRCQQSAAGFLGFLGSQDGGLKACVRAERAARRAEQGRPPDATERARDLLRQIDATGLITDPDGGTEEFVLVLGRRSVNQPGVIEVLRVLDEQPTVVAATVKKVAAELKRQRSSRTRRTKAGR